MTILATLTSGQAPFFRTFARPRRPPHPAPARPVPALYNLLVAGQLIYDWIAWISGTLLGLTALSLLIWALFCDPRRWQRRCPKCWYDMRGNLDSRRCPECGFEARRDRQLHRVRRRWSWAFIGVLVLILAATVALTPQVQREGPMSLVPLTVLLWRAPPAGSERPVSAVETELVRRFNAGAELSDRQWRYVLTHKNILHVRPRWPQDVPRLIDLRKPRWLAPLWLPVPNKGQPAGLGMGWMMWSLGPPASPATELRIDLNLQRRRGGDPARLVLTFPCETVAEPEDALARAADATVDEAMRTALQITPFVYVARPRPGTIQADPRKREVVAQVSFNPDPSGLACRIAAGFRLDLLRDGALQSSVCLQKNPRVRVASADQGLDNKVVLPSPPGPWSVRITFRRCVPFEELDHWAVRLRGDAEAALTDWDADEYWPGEIVVPLTHEMLR